MDGFCEYGNEPSSSISCWEVLEKLSYWRFLKKVAQLVVFLLQGFS
jgi:hypothetical protein